MPVKLRNAWDVKNTMGEQEDVGEDSTGEWRSLFACGGKRLAYLQWLEIANLLCRRPEIETLCTC